MTQDNDQAMMEEVVLPEHLLPLGTVLGPGVSALDLCVVLAKIFRVQNTEVAMLRLEGGLLRFVFPEHLRTSGAIPLSSKAVAAHTALSKKAEIFNNFARVKHASIFETVKVGTSDSDDLVAPSPIQKLMSVPIMDRGSFASRRSAGLFSARCPMTCRRSRNISAKRSRLASSACCKSRWS